MSLLSNFWLLWVAMSFFLFIRWRKEREMIEMVGTDVGPLLLGSWHKMSVFAMNLSENIGFRDKALLSGKMGWVSILAWFIQLIFDRINPALISGLDVLLSW